jgi:cytochrome c-type biogenesis protein CcmH
MALVYYQISGAPAVPSVAFADRQVEREQARQTAKLTDQLLNKLSSAPDGGPTEGWLLLGRTYMSSGLFEEAAGVFEKLSTRADSNSATWSMLAEALIRLDNGVVTPKAENAISRSMALDSLNPAAAYYKALALAQTGREVEAHRLLVQRLKLSETYAPWMDSLVRQANSIGKSLGKPELDVSNFVDLPMRGPTAADVVAAQEMSAEDRTQFIRSMVEGLAARLEDQPDDLEGWLRLANAYKVLEERARAVMAYERADELIRNKFSSDDPRRQNIKDAISELKE